ncbi:MAG TPA: trypsin-like peptidase domain-containing protein [Steroidobacteraceae bacterium]|nr:trypsin-like peptidase domain-containing protein [Steroidobacteraceae bacterium]
MFNCFRLTMFALFLSIGAAAMAEPPKAVVDSICRPTFELKDQSLSAGTAFLMETGTEKQPLVLVTAHHLLGPMGGLPAEVAWNDVPKSVKRASCKSIAAPAQSWTGAPLAIPGAASFNNQTKDGLRDIALLTVQAKPAARPLKLAPAQPKLGDTVWLVAQLVSGAPQDKLLFKAKVVKVQDLALNYLIDDPQGTFDLRATSGAPVVNERGEVIAVNIAGSRVAGGFNAAGISGNVVRKALESVK